MFRLPVSKKIMRQRTWVRSKSSSSFLRSTFVEYFVGQHGHKHVKSSPVVPLCDPTVPFVNAGMNQFKGVFLGTVDPPAPRVVNSQKCIRVGGKHNDLDVVGTDGHHHTFFEMLGNWSFNDYYKKEACQMAWELLLGPYQLKPEQLVVTYFGGDAVIGLPEDKECRDVWKDIGVSPSRLQARGAADNFWEMGATGPCGPCTEIHYINDDGSLTEIWNLVFIHCNRESDGKVSELSHCHVDTGLGLERLAAILQRAPTNYDTDLFKPLLRIIQQHTTAPPYSGQFCADAVVDTAYRRLADHARMVSICLSDGAMPATSLNLKQIMRKSFKISTDIFKSPQLLLKLYDEVATSLGPTYPELVSKEKDAKLVIAHEEESYGKLRKSLEKKWKDLARIYPEVEALSDVEMSGFSQGYKELKEAMYKQNTTQIPGELVFKLYDTYGFQQDLIDRIARINNFNVDKENFEKLLAQHKTRHKTAFKEQIDNRGTQFDKCIKKLIENGVTSTNDQHKYDFIPQDNKVYFEPLKTKLVALLDEDLEWIDVLDPCEDRPFYLVTEDTNFYCEEGGQIADTGIIRLDKEVIFKVESVFKIRDFIFHKGYFKLNTKYENSYVNVNSECVLEIDSERRVNIMRNHTATHLLNAAVRKTLPNSVVYQIGSSVTDKGLSLNLSLYGEKLSQQVVMDIEDTVRQSIRSNAAVRTRILDGVIAGTEAGLTRVPGEAYPETGLRVVEEASMLESKELCCGTHVPSTGLIEDFCVTSVRGAGSHTPAIHGITGTIAKQARELFCRTEKLRQVIDLIDPERKAAEIAAIRSQLAAICIGGGAPSGHHASCLQLLDVLQKTADSKNEVELKSLAREEINDALIEARAEGRRFVVHFLRVSYLMTGGALEKALEGPLAFEERAVPALLMGCGGGVIVACCTVPKELTSSSFDAAQWLRCVLPVFGVAAQPAASRTAAAMIPAKVSLITCEQQVQDAMQLAIEYAQTHLKDNVDSDTDEHTKNRRHN